MLDEPGVIVAEENSNARHCAFLAVREGATIRVNFLQTAVVLANGNLDLVFDLDLLANRQELVIFLLSLVVILLRLRAAMGDGSILLGKALHPLLRSLPRLEFLVLGRLDTRVGGLSFWPECVDARFVANSHSIETVGGRVWVWILALDE